MRFPYSYFAVLLFFGLLSSLPLAAQDSLQLSPEEAVRAALLHNPSQQIARESESLARTSYRLSKGAFLPGLSATAGRNWTVQSVEQVRSNNEVVTRDNARSDNTTAGISADWTLFDGLGMFYAYDRLRLLYQASESATREEASLLASQVLATYYQYILQEARVQVLEQTLPISIERRRLARDRYELGRSSKLELLSAQVDFNADSAALLTQQQSLTQIKHALNLLMGRRPEAAFQVSDTLLYDSAFVYNLPTPELLEQNPGLKAARLEQLASEQFVKQQKARHWPSLQATAGYNYINQNTEVGFALSNQVTGFTYGFTASWPIFNRFFVRQQIQQANVQANIARQNLRQLSLELKTAYADALAAHRLQRVQSKLEKENLEVARQNADIALDRYKLGVSTSLELRVAQQNALQAELRLLDVLYALKLSEINLLQLSGQLPTTL